MVLHNASNGRAWSRGDGQGWNGWGLQSSLQEWSGVTVKDGRAVGLKLYLCNLMGEWNLWRSLCFEKTAWEICRGSGSFHFGGGRTKTVCVGRCRGRYAQNACLEYPRSGNTHEVELRWYTALAPLRVVLQRAVRERLVLQGGGCLTEEICNPGLVGTPAFEISDDNDCTIIPLTMSRTCACLYLYPQVSLPRRSGIYRF